MIRRSTWILVGVLLVLIGVAVYLQRNPGALPSGTPTPSVTPVMQVLSQGSSTDVSQISIQPAQGQALALKKGANGEWRFDPDTGEPVDQGQVQQLLDTLYSLIVQSAVPADTPLDAMGLTAPQQVISLQLSNGQSVRIQIGNQTPTGSGYYLRVDDGPATVVDQYSVSTLVSGLDKQSFLPPTPTPAETGTAQVTPALTPSAGTAPQATATPVASSSPQASFTPAASPQQ
jgi:hypothetical protein